MIRMAVNILKRLHEYIIMQIKTNLIPDLGNFDNQRRYKESLSKLNSHTISHSELHIGEHFVY